VPRIFATDDMSSCLSGGVLLELAQRLEIRELVLVDWSYIHSEPIAKKVCVPSWCADRETCCGTRAGEAYIMSLWYQLVFNSSMKDSYPTVRLASSVNPFDM